MESNPWAIACFSGTANYQTTFNHTPDSTHAVILDLGSVKNFADVILNGQPIATLWKAPWRLDISEKVRPGSNTLQVNVTNLWVNRLIGDEQLPPEEGESCRCPPYRCHDRTGIHFLV